MLKADIDAGRPIYYDGVNTTVTPNTAHAWVVDGYKTDNTFHCNWGWNGSDSGADDWFSLNDLTPGSHNYNSNQRAILGAEPILDACSGLAGATVICSSNESYSVSIPSSATVKWTKSSNLDQVGGNTGTTYTVNEGGTGVGYVTATIKNSQGDTFLTRTKNVHVGAPPAPYVSQVWDVDANAYTSNTLNTGKDYRLDMYCNSFPDDCADNDSDHQWFSTVNVDNSMYDLTLGGYVVNSASCNFNLSTEGTYVFKARYIVDEGNCNYSRWTSKSLTFQGGMLLMLSPNPANEATTISLEVASSDADALKSTSTQNTFDESAEWEYEVYSNMRSLKAKKTKIRGKSTRLNTQDWKEGVYTVRAKYKDQVLTGKLVVKK